MLENSSQNVSEIFQKWFRNQHGNYADNYTENNQIIFRNKPCSETRISNAKPSYHVGAPGVVEPELFKMILNELETSDNLGKNESLRVDFSMIHYHNIVRVLEQNYVTA